MAPRIFGIEHILYLFVCILLMSLFLILIKKYIHSEKKLNILIRALGFILFIAIMWNRISININKENFFAGFLPGSFCGATSLFLSIAAMVLKKNHAAFYCLIYVGLLGGLVTIFYPDFIGQAESFFYPMTISGLVHHTVMVFLIMIMIFSGYVQPDLNKWYYLFLGLALYMCYGLLLITVLGYGDAMHIYTPLLEGTALNWIVLGLLFLPIHLGFLICWRYIVRKKPQVLFLK
ncbi:MAG: hypothetical protein WCY04_03545 [Bacilli bacterium]